MKVISILLSFLITILCLSCKHTYLSASEQLQLDRTFLTDFYKSTKGLSKEKVANFIGNDLQYLDSIYYIEYITPINGYSIKVVLNNFEQLADIAYIGSATMLLTDSCRTRILIHPDFSLSDSIAEQLKTKTINQLDYKVMSDAYYKINQLGQFSNVPFAFFDVDFDGEMELLLRHPHLGQRGSSAYSPYRASTTNRNCFEEHYIIKEDKHVNIPKLDDMTEFDKENREVIEYSPTDQDGNLKLYYKLSDKNVFLSKIETFDNTWKQLLKRVIYTEEPISQTM